MKSIIESLAFAFQKRAALIILFLVIASLSALKITTSSIGGWSGGGILLGTARGIRADEYLRLTPTTVSYLHGTELSPWISGGNFLLGWPDISILGLVSNPEFFLAKVISNFNPEVGFAFIYQFRLMLFFSCCYIWFRNFQISRLNSVIFTLLIYLIPVVQWWSLSFINLISNAIALALCVRLYFRSKSQKHETLLVLLCGFLIIRSSTGYPLASLIFTCFFLLLEAMYIWTNSDRTASQDNRLLLKKTAKVVFGSISMFSLYLFTAKDYLYTLTNTVYPGQRESVRVNLPLADTFSLPGISILQLSNSELSTSNRSEAANGTLLFLVPIVILLSLHFLKFIQIKKMAIFLPAIIVTLITTVWSLTDIVPGDFKPLFISKLPPQRGSQISSILIVFLWILIFSKVEWKWIEKTQVSGSKNGVLKIFMSINSTVVGIIGLFATMSFAVKYEFTIPLAMIFVSSIVFAFTISLASVQIRSTHLIPLVFLMFLSTGLVNPIQSGLGKLHSSDIRNEILKVQSIGGFAAGVGMQEDALLQLNGIPIIGGQMNVGPYMEKWIKLDPSLKYFENWNRGSSYLTFTPRAGSLEVSNPTVDQVIVSYDPCNIPQELRDLKTIVSFAKQDFYCLDLAGTLFLGVNKVPLYLYSRQ